VKMNMRLAIITIGKGKNKAIHTLADDYLGRLKHYVNLEHIVAKDEADALKKISLREVASPDYVWLCEESGTQYTSKEFADQFRVMQLYVRATPRSAVFVIGDAAGHGDAMKARADGLLSFSKMTLPHEFAFVVLLEQIYRAFTILKGEPYHK